MPTGGNMEPLGARRRRMAENGEEEERSSSRKRSRSPARRSPPRRSSRRRSTRSRSRSPPRRSSRLDKVKSEIKDEPGAENQDNNDATVRARPASTPHEAGRIRTAGKASSPAPTSTRKRKSRWGNEKAFVPGMPTMLPSDLSDEQQKLYLLQLRIEDCSRKLRTGDMGIPSDPSQRSPSPEPIYDGHGKRLNTREVRTRAKVETIRHQSIQEMMKLNPIYKPPLDYKAPTVKLTEKVHIPQAEHPEVNFVGLLIGPRGNTLKGLEKDTGTKIIIRGKGSVKEAKIQRPDRAPMPGEDEPLHAFITATDEECLKNCVDKIQGLVTEAIAAPDNYVEMRKVQLRELAMLNGTYRPEDVMGGGRCQNCGEMTHKTWECHNAPNVTANIICTICGAAGHISRDCKAEAGFMGNDNPLDEEYSAFMSELGEGPPPGSSRGGPPTSRGGSGPPPRMDRPPPEHGEPYGGGRFPLRGGPPGGPVMRVNLAHHHGGPPPGPYSPRGPHRPMFRPPPHRFGHGGHPGGYPGGPPGYGGYGGYDGGPPGGYGGPPPGHEMYGGPPPGWGAPPPPPPHSEANRPGPVPPPKGGGSLLRPPPPPPNMDLSSLFAPPPPPE